MNLKSTPALFTCVYVQLRCFIPFLHPIQPLPQTKQHLSWKYIENLSYSIVYISLNQTKIYNLN